MPYTISKQLQVNGADAKAAKDAVLMSFKNPTAGATYVVQGVTLNFKAAALTGAGKYSVRSTRGTSDNELLLFTSSATQAAGTSLYLQPNPANIAAVGADAAVADQFFLRPDDTLSVVVDTQATSDGSPLLDILIDLNMVNAPATNMDVEA